MSAGAFIRSFYETNGGGIARIKVQPETELFSVGAAFNDGADGPPTIATRVKVSKGRQEYGIGPRKISFVHDDGQTPVGYKPGTIFYIPALTRSFYDGVVAGSQGTYLGGTGEVLDKLEESVR